MLSRKISIAMALLALAAAPTVASAAGSGPLIRGAEVGYFGSATVAHTVSVFVYSSLGPAAGNRVTVCLEGKCERARGHTARLSWYAASFRTRPLRMGDALRFTVLATAGARRSQISVSRDLLCMHNDGSTPQS